MSLLSSGALPIAVGVAAAFWGVRWLAYGRPSIPTPPDWTVTVLVLLVAVTLEATAFPDKTIPQVYRLLTGVGLFYAIANWGSSKARLHQLILRMVLSGRNWLCFP